MSDQDMTGPGTSASGPGVADGPAGSAGTGDAQAAATRLRLPPQLPRGLRQTGILIPFVILFTVLSIASGPFFTRVNLLNILDQQAATLTIAAAGTLVLVAGGIDLSVGATYALAGVTAAHLAQSGSPALAIGAGLAVGLLVGLANGVITTLFRINSLIATLAMSFAPVGSNGFYVRGAPRAASCCSATCLASPAAT